MFSLLLAVITWKRAGSRLIFTEEGIQAVPTMATIL
jgi:hypothetical protein